MSGKSQGSVVAALRGIGVNESVDLLISRPNEDDAPGGDVPPDCVITGTDSEITNPVGLHENVLGQVSFKLFA